MHKASISQNCQVQQRFCKLQLVYLLYGNVCLHILARTCKAADCSGTHSSDSSEPKCFTPPLYFAKFTFSEMLPTALPYHTPAKLSRAFFVRRHTAGRQQQDSSPTPRPPQGGRRTSEGGTRERPHFKEGQPARAGPLSFRPGRAPDTAPARGLLGCHGKNGWGAPCCQAAARTPRPVGLPLPTRAAGRRAGSVRFAHSTKVPRGAARAPPFIQTAAIAAAGRAAAVARAACLRQANPLRGRASPGLDPAAGRVPVRALVLVAPAPPYEGGRCSLLGPLQ